MPVYNLHPESGMTETIRTGTLLDAEVYVRRLRAQQDDCDGRNEYDLEEAEYDEEHRDR